MPSYAGSGERAAVTVWPYARRAVRVGNGCSWRKIRRARRVPSETSAGTSSGDCNCFFGALTRPDWVCVTSRPFSLILRAFAMPTGSEHILVRRHRVEHAEIYELFGDDLRRIEDEGARVGTHFQFATSWLPVAIALTVTLSTATIQSDRTFYSLEIFTVISYGFGIFHGVCAWQQRGRFKAIMAEIRQRKAGPLGEQGHELKPAQLEDLPSEKADGA
jgi:hypothetical protein